MATNLANLDLNSNVTNAIINKVKYYKIPSYINSEGEFHNIDEDLLDHLHLVIESSKSFLRSNRAWKIIEICRKIYFGDDKDLALFPRDTWVDIQKLRRQGRELVGNAANIRPNFSIRSPKGEAASGDKSATYEELKNHWWYDRFVDRTFKEAMQEASSGLGYIWQWPKKDPNTGSWEICAEAKSYKEVFPYQMGSDNDIDKAYSVTVWCELPMAEFFRLFPHLEGKVNPDRNAPSYVGKKFSRSNENFGGGLRGHLRRGFDKKTGSAIDPSFPVKDVFYTYTRDNSINQTEKDIKMGTLTSGDLGGHDSYIVKPNAKLFPYGPRLTIWTKDLIISDGPPKWLCDCPPIADFRFERLPKEYIGVPVLNDGRSMELAINRIVNSIISRLEALSKFPIGIDESLPKNVVNVIQRKGLRALVGKALKMNFRIVGNKPIQALFDRDLFKVENHEIDIVKSLLEFQDYVTGTNDYSNLQRKNQVPAADTQEALIQSLGVLSVDHEREISLGIKRMGRIWLQFAPQVYTLKKRISVIGSNAVDIKDLDYDPESLVPKLDPKAGDLPYWLRLKQHLQKYNLFAMPGSLQERQSTTNKLLLIQLLKIGGRISDEKLYNAFINDDKFEETAAQWASEQIEKAKLAANIRKEVEAIAGAGGSPEGQGIIQQIVAMLSQQKTINEGRPSLNNTMPRLETKLDQDGALRSTNATN